MRVSAVIDGVELGSSETKNVDVSAGSSTTVSLTINENTAAGSITINVNAASLSTLNAVLMKAGSPEAASSVSLTRSGDTFVGTLNLSPGFYAIGFSADNAEVSAYDTVRIYSGIATVYSGSYNNSTGTINADVQNNIVKTPEIKLTAPETIALNQILHVYAAVSGMSNPTYQWFINGEAVEYNGSNLTYSLSGYSAEDELVVTCLVSNENIIWSESTGIIRVTDNVEGLEEQPAINTSSEDLSFLGSTEKEQKNYLLSIWNDFFYGKDVPTQNGTFYDGTLIVSEYEYAQGVFSGPGTSAKYTLNAYETKNFTIWGSNQVCDNIRGTYLIDVVVRDNRTGKVFNVYFDAQYVATGVKESENYKVNGTELKFTEVEQGGTLPRETAVSAVQETFNILGNGSSNLLLDMVGTLLNSIENIKDTEMKHFKLIEFDSSTFDVKGTTKVDIQSEDITLKTGAEFTSTSNERTIIGQITLHGSDYDFNFMKIGEATTVILKQNGVEVVVQESDKPMLERVHNYIMVLFSDEIFTSSKIVEKLGIEMELTEGSGSFILYDYGPSGACFSVKTSGYTISVETGNGASALYPVSSPEGIKFDMDMTEIGTDFILDGSFSLNGSLYSFSNVNASYVRNDSQYYLTVYPGTVSINSESYTF